MPGYLLHMGATVLCSHAGQAEPTVTEPARDGERPGGRHAARPIHGRRLLAAAPSRGQWPVLDGDVDHRGAPDHGRGRARAPRRQSINLRTHGNAPEHSGDTASREGNMMNLNFPLQFDRTGRTAAIDDDDHIGQMIELLLFTSPGERVNRPDFGSGLQKLIFAPNSPELASALQFSIKASITRWLGDLIDLKNFDVTSEDSTLYIHIEYVIRRTQAPQTLDLTRQV